MSDAVRERELEISAARPRERDLARAWAIHDPARAKIPFAARRAARAFRESLAGDATKIKRTYASPDFRRVLNDWARSAALGRSHACQRVATALAPAVVDVVGGALRMLWIESHENPLVLIDDPRFRQASALVVGAVVRRTGRSVGAANGFPIVECSDHALARLFQRSPNVDARAALIEAACAFLAADWRTVEAKRLKGGTVCLKAGSGLLLTEALFCADIEKKPRLFARATTFIHDAMREPDQRPTAPAVDPSATVLAAVSRG